MELRTMARTEIHVKVNGEPVGLMRADKADVVKILDLFSQRCAELGREPLEVARLGVSRLASGEAAPHRRFPHCISRPSISPGRRMMQ
jgi:hypothetical protein